MKSTKLTILTLTTLVLAVVVSGCVPRLQKTNQDVIPAQAGIQKDSQDNVATTTAEIDTSSWKTYRNEEYGFEVKYPGKENINIKSNSNDYGTDPGEFSYFFGAGDNGITIIPIKQETVFNTNILILKHITNSNQTNNIYNEQQLVINGNKAIQFDTKGTIGLNFEHSMNGSVSRSINKDMRLIFIQGQDITVFAFFPLTEKYNPSLSSLYKLIIYSLKFIE